MLLGLKYEDLSWEYAKPSKEDDPNCFPCLFLQFLVTENGARVSKILQVFSRQASLMDTLITSFVNYGKLKSGENTSGNCEGFTNSQEGNHYCQIEIGFESLLCRANRKFQSYFINISITYQQTQQTDFSNVRRRW